MISGLLELNSEKWLSATIIYLILSGIGAIFVILLIFGMKDVVNEDEFKARRQEKKNAG